jgi:hypothetical protein
MFEAFKYCVIHENEKEMEKMKERKMIRLVSAKLSPTTPISVDEEIGCYFQKKDSNRCYIVTDERYYKAYNDNNKLYLKMRSTSESKTTKYAQYYYTLLRDEKETINKLTLLRFVFSSSFALDVYGVILKSVADLSLC